MMKNLSLVLNIILLVAVGYLYYSHFTDKNPRKPFGKVDGKSGRDSAGCGKWPIAYVDLDSLNENISYIKIKRKELESEQKAIESEWESGYRGLQAAKDNFLKKGAAITQDEAEKFQNQLLEQQQKIDGTKQASSQKLSEKSFAIMDDIQKKMKQFLADYNKEGKYIYILTTGTGQDYMAYKDSTMNITGDVIKGMNEKLKSMVK